MALLEWAAADLPISRQAGLLGLNRTHLYYQPAAPPAAALTLKRRIDEIYTATPFYGIRRITAQLHREGVVVNHKAVARHMREMGLVALYPGPNLSRRAQQAAVYPYLLRGLAITRANQVWSIDITYIRLAAGWLYLVAVLDWYSRYIISWELDQTLAQPFVTAAVQTALGTATPEIFNSDQGSHFTSPQYTGLLKAAGTRISMDGRGRALDNVFVERLWRTVKQEEVYLHEYQSPREARTQLTAYLAFYNERRLHQALDYQTPAEVYRAAPG